jgi:hypothetical protein
MSAEKRKVATDALETLGSIIDDTAGRDAIHLAVEPIIAGEILYAGQHIGIVDRHDGVRVASTKATKKLGIVDPFIQGPVPEGSRFWFVVYPRQITSLRHVWSHPNFPEGDVVIADKKKVSEIIHNNPDKTTIATYNEIHEKHISEEWIRNYAIRIPLDYNVLMNGAHDYQRYGNYLSFGSLLEGEYLPDEFWDHYEMVTGEKVDSRGNFFSCSC